MSFLSPYPASSSEMGGGSGVSVPTGTTLMGFWAEAPSGYLLCNGGSIGDTASGATYAAADAEALYVLLWASVSDLYCSVTGGRGLSAAEDWTAHKLILLPDLRRRAPVGADPGTPLAGLDAQLGAFLGAEAHTLAEGELPVVAGHAHGFSVGIPDNGGAGSEFGFATISSGIGSLVSIGGSTASAGGFGGGQAHNNTQLSLVVNFAIKL